MPKYIYPISTVSARKAAPQGIDPSTDTQIVDYVTVDIVGNNMSFNIFTGDLTINRTGTYLLYYSIWMEPNSTGVRNSYITKDGSIVTQYAPHRTNALSSTATRQSASIAINATSGDTFQLFMWQNSAAILDVGDGTSNGETFFQATELSVSV